MTSIVCFCSHKKPILFRKKIQCLFRKKMGSNKNKFNFRYHLLNKTSKKLPIFLAKSTLQPPSPPDASPVLLPHRRGPVGCHGGSNSCGTWCQWVETCEGRSGGGLLPWRIGPQDLDISGFHNHGEYISPLTRDVVFPFQMAELHGGNK